jgi:predicted transcriptional regulator
MRAGDALGPGGAPAGAALPEVAADASLREVLNLFLEGAPAIAVLQDGRTAGTLTMADVQRAVRGKG